MIAEIKFRNNKAVLQDSGKWDCADAGFQLYLNSMFSPLTPQYTSPADGGFGAKHVRLAAERLGATITWGPVPASPEGRVY